MKKILIIGMADSIHVGRWIEQFESDTIEFSLFPSKYFRKLHPLLDQLSKSNLRLSNSRFGTRFHGYFDYLCFEIPRKIFHLDLRVRALSRIIRDNHFDFIHCLEIQGAGYLIADASKFLKLDLPKVILTNWGSDIYYFKDIPEHLDRIQEVLSIADAYSAECLRDYALAKRLGFSGRELPCIPNAGGFSVSAPEIKASERKLILVKGYGGIFGRAILSLEAVDRCLQEFPDVAVFVYSVTPDLETRAKELQNMYSDRFEFATTSRPLSREQMSSLFYRARIYLGCSVSDGLSTSFLEALVGGAFPIQTNTSCAGELISRGASGRIVDLNFAEIFSALKEAIQSDSLVDEAQNQNYEFAKQFLGKEYVYLKARSYYEWN
jgi:glycosyltransferase involved in cell wall biosynthesis